jgi:hypothetical protein
MELLRGAIHRLCALVLCWSLCFPVPLAMAQDAAENQKFTQTKHRPEYAAKPEPGQLQGDARILHALNRLTFGPRDGDLEAVRSMGPGEIGLDKWFDGQLHPENIDETDLNARLAEFPAMQWSTQDLMFRMPGPAIIRQAVDGKIEIPRGGTLHAVYENQIYRYQLRKAAQADKQVSKPASQQVSGPADTGSPAMSANGAGGKRDGPGRQQRKHGRARKLERKSGRERDRKSKPQPEHGRGRGNDAAVPGPQKRGTGGTRDEYGRDAAGTRAAAGHERGGSEYGRDDNARNKSGVDSGVGGSCG